MKELLDSLNILFTPELVKASLLLALLSTSGAIGLFFYMGISIKKSCLPMWALSWMFYAMYLATSIALVESPKMLVLVVTEHTSVGISAVFLFYGVYQLVHAPRRNKEIGWAIVMVTIWNGVAVYTEQHSLWAKLPMFALLAGASLYTGFVHARAPKANKGTRILRTAFTLWSVHALSVPFLGSSQGVIAFGYFTAALFPLVIAAGVVIQEETSVAEGKYRGVFDAAQDAIFLVDLYSLKILEANSSACRLMQQTEGDLTGRLLSELCPNVKAQGTTGQDHRTLIDAVIRRYNRFAIVRPNGTTLLCEGDTTLMRWQNRPVLQINMREVDKNAKVGDQIRRGEKLSALGQLIAGVAHELNNPLAIVMGYSQLLAKQKSLDQKTKGDILKILHESERAAKIVRNLLTFVRPCEPQKVPLDINRLVSNVLDIRERELGDNKIQLEKQLASTLARTKADPHQIEQIITNLVTNAIQALADHASNRKLTVATEENGFSVRIMVADNGPGIGKDVATKIFDPFFTTKPPGKGTGLGLTISHSIVEEHRGKIWVETAPNRGCKFFVELPLIACEDESKPPVSLPRADQRVTGRSDAEHRLLLVDDEPGILGVLQEVLRENGYKVETASNGAEAIRQMKTNQYDLIISDLCMPEVDGKQLYQQIHDSDPEMANRIAFLTGDTVSNNSREFLESTGNRWFSKPFSVTDIEKFVREFLLNGPSSQKFSTHNGRDPGQGGHDEAISQFTS